MASPLKLKQRIYQAASAGRVREADEQLDKLLRSSKGDHEVWFLYGIVKGELGDYAAAVTGFSRSIALNPGNIESYTNLGLAYIRTGNFGAAIQTYNNVIKRAPSHSGAYFHLGYAQLHSGDYSAAVNSLTQAVRLDPGNLQACLYLAKAFKDCGLTSAAFNTVNKGLLQDPRHKDLLIMSISLHLEKGDMDSALEQIDFLLENEPGCLQALALKAIVYEKTAFFDEAREIVAPLLSAGVKDPDLAVVCARLSTNNDERERAVRYIEEIIEGNGDIEPEVIGTLDHQLGLLLDKLGRYDEAFTHFRAFNESRRIPYDAERYKLELEDIRRVFTREFMLREQLPVAGAVTPIFIVGMPRSGTTLAEQILASHPHVFGAGELCYMDDLLKALANSGTSGIGYPHCLEDIDKNVLISQRDYYLEKIEKLSSGVDYVTDKMPHNFQHLGIISILFPNAKIVHCRRYPVDTCISMYFNDLNVVHSYASDLSMLGEHYMEYLRTMSYWKDVLSVAIHDFVYEAVIESQEKASRELLEFCELDWDPACLEFYSGNRAVNTPSYDQVRKPIYTSSVERWRNYEKYLKPLLDALGPFDT